MKSSTPRDSQWLPELSSARSAVAVAAAMVAIGLVSRFLPHPPNFSPIGSLALFGGAMFASRRMAVLVPLAAMLISDMFLGFHVAMWATYGCFAASVMLGRWIRRQPGVMRITTAGLASSTLFFVMTNLAVWMKWYDPSLAGLVTCFTAAIPFFQNTLASDAIFTVAMFGSAALASRPVTQLRPLAQAV
ncbi:DUF6580 family putative transport protein [Crateriforma spongiae]|uniref:DUF6580 family putative transport protein n=1 Tax=Crateriforma spongiae TaxID=2724528 RepID=UPI00197E1E42|nr:DUF6580 family putative transport protein [Crateriforma spongiae]